MGLLLTIHIFGPECKIEELCDAADRSSINYWSFGENIAIRLADF